ncbi:unnamed protein product [Didymodactylos carnosus]|uniref:RNA-directed DNA polymerase n=1 Tax=Didymodactylos carnosus TaxID=1234261 RepID=A0A814FH31_9BILA|nr:unnamed protein product [Didymodactylos carnosus]CAF1109115.1 unnamed protein product [Didymodactylos carnosus]CAF3755705.1 unnamed protein product [Didymodactylos carnosus]CAF3875281.1 unnamed protein product [Didymodactylos carnosus]
MSDPPDPIVQQCHRDMMKNVEFAGDESETVHNFLNEIKAIGEMTNQIDTTLFLMAISKLTGSARQWYIDNKSAIKTWSTLQQEMIQRFKRTTSSIKTELRERKQQLDEPVTKYYDDIIRLCREIDPQMTDSMIIGYLEDGLRDDLQEQTMLQMSVLSESDKTTIKFLQIAKTVEEVRKRRQYSEPAAQPYFVKSITTALQATPYQFQNIPQPTNPYLQYKNPRYLPNQRTPTSRQQGNPQPRPSFLLKNPQQPLNSSLPKPNQYDPCLICARINHRTIDCYYKKPSGCYKCGQPDHLSSLSSSPIYIQVQVNATPQHAIVDTESAVTIINQRLLTKIHHKKFIYKRKSYSAANCTSVNIVSEIQLEVKIHGYRTYINADVATNLVTDLLLGNDWIEQNNIVIDTPQRRIIIVNKYFRIITSTSFVEPPDLHYPVFLINQVTIPSYSERYIDVQVPSLFGNINNVMFEPIGNLYSKSILTAKAVLNVNNSQTRIVIINANNRQFTLSKNTKLGVISYQSGCNICLTIPATPNERSARVLANRSCVLPVFQKRKVRFTDPSCRARQTYDCHYECYVCHEKYLTGNDLQQHLRQKCFPSEIRQQIENLTKHIENPKHRQQLQDILWKHGKLFDFRQPSVIKTTLRHAIDTSNHPPIYTPPYRHSWKDEQIQREEIDKLLKQDAEYFTIIDFKSGYFQVPLDPKDRPKTAFSTRDQHLQFTVLPQGVTNGPPTFQRIVNQILGPTRWKYALAYLDDIIIYSQTFEDHLLHLDDILNRLNQANFRLNVDKCNIAQQAIDYLGHHIEHGNIMPNADNIRALLNTPQPTTAKEAFRFVKAAEYYRKFISGFSKIAQPLYKYAPTTKQQHSRRSQSTPITLSNEEQQAFIELKRILTSDLALRIPNDQLPFKIQTDASKLGIGAVLMQTYSNGDLPVAYLSKKLSSTQMKWPATEIECYAIISAIEKWHKYLDGRPFTVETDHKPLEPLNLKQQLNMKCERWRLKLQRYQFTIRYIKGKYNTMADYLSRSPVDDATEDQDDYVSMQSRSTQTEDPISSPYIVAPVVTQAQAKQKTQDDKRNVRPLTDQSCVAQQQNRNVPIPVDRACVAQNYQQIIDDTQIIPFTLDDIKRQQDRDDQVEHIKNNIKNFKHYFIDDGILMRKQQHPIPSVPYVPKGRIRVDILKIYHDTAANGAHFGRDKTTRKIQHRYFWPSMVKDIRNHIQSCIPCLQNNHLRRKSPGSLKPIRPPEGVWQLLSMDFHGPITSITQRGNKYIISLTDVLTDDEVILKYGTPRCIIPDNGTHFTANIIEELFKQIGVTHLYSTPYHPMTNGQIERYNATMDAKIAALCNEKRTDWDEQLPFVSFNYNTSIHTTTGQIPFEMMYGRSPVLPFDHQQPVVSLSKDPQHVQKLNQYLSTITEGAKRNIIQQQQKYKQRYDTHRSDPKHKVGNLVLVKTISSRNKFDIRHEGPFQIVQQIGRKTFIVQHVKKLTLIKQITTDSIVPLFERTYSTN